MRTTSRTTTSPSSQEAAIEQLDGYVRATALRLSRTNRARRAGAEVDDLIQEGRLSILNSLTRGTDPVLPIENRMKDYISWLIRWRRADPVPYEAMLPLETSGGGE